MAGGAAAGWLDRPHARLALSIEIDQTWGLVRLPRSVVGLLAAAGVVAMAVLDFMSAALEEVLVEPQHIAAGAALCTGFLGCRALAIIVRSTRAPHVRLHDTA